MFARTNSKIYVTMATNYTAVRVTTAATTAVQDNSSGVEVITDQAATNYDGTQVIIDTTNNIVTLFDSNGYRKIFEQAADITISIQGT